MDKLERYGVLDKFKALISSYLTNRYQKVTLGKIGEKGKFIKMEADHQWGTPGICTGSLTVSYIQGEA